MGVEAPEDVVRSLIDMLEEAQADEVDVIVMSLPSNDTDLLRAINETADSGIPIYTINAGHRWFQDLPIRTHIGLVEGITGTHVLSSDSKNLVKVEWCAVKWLRDCKTCVRTRFYASLPKRQMKIYKRDAPPSETMTSALTW